MNLPHDIRFLSHNFFMQALRKWGAVDQLVKASIAAAKLQVIINEGLLKKQTKVWDVELIACIADMEIYLSQIVAALSIQSETKMKIQARLEELNGEALEK